MENVTPVYFYASRYVPIETVLNAEISRSLIMHAKLIFIRVIPPRPLFNALLSVKYSNSLTKRYNKAK